MSGAGILSTQVSFFFVCCCIAQVTTGNIGGVVYDPSGGAVPRAKIAIKNLDTSAHGQGLTADDGTFRFPSLPVGSYELTVEKAGFAKYKQGPIVLRLNQYANLEIKLRLASAAETVAILSDAPLVNTADAQVGVNFESRRISELPVAPGRNILNLALSVAGVSQLSSNQAVLTRSGVDSTGYSGIAFSVNGMRLRSNNFMIDGQDNNEAALTGLVQSVNNPEVVAEFRLITNQFAPEYGRSAGSVVNILTKSGTNQLHGSALWFHNDQHLNSRSNLDKGAGFPAAPFRIENQFGSAVGGPIVRSKTFFFMSAQRWTDRRVNSGTSIRGVPTEEGRALLQSMAGDRQTVRILLENLPAAQSRVSGLAAPLTVGGRTVAIPLGILTGSSNVIFNDWQWSARVDHRFNDRYTLGGRYLFDDDTNDGSGQATPPGLAASIPERRQSASAFLNSTMSPRAYDEVRLSYWRYARFSTYTDPASIRIPSIEVPELGLTGFNASSTRTAVGLNVTSPTYYFQNNYQLQDTIGVIRGPHSMKFGIDFRKQDVSWFFFPVIRGRLVYNTLQDLADDLAQTALINGPLRGGQPMTYFKYFDYFFFLQDQWRIGPSFNLTYGIRYESPGNSFSELAKQNRAIVAAAGGDPRYAMSPVPKRDTNNWAPRVGFNYRLPRIRWLTGDRKLVLRGGYARTYDFAFVNIGSNVGSSFPFQQTVTLAPRTPNSYDALQHSLAAATIPNPNLLTRTTVSADFRSPYAEQFSLQAQRELTNDWLLSVGWIGTKGTALFQSIDGNPAVPGSRGQQRVNPSKGVIRERCNCGSSIYHSLQVSLEKRLSRDFSMGAHYTWSTFIDEASDIFNPSNSGEVAVAQDSFNRRADRGRASYDRPQRLAVNGVYELPFRRHQIGTAGRILGGWQISGFLTLQSGAPFTALDGGDPGFRLSGIDSQVGNAIRANANTTLDLARMSVEEMARAGSSKLFSRVTADAPLGNLGRNILRADGIANLDLGVLKNTRFAEGRTIQFRAEFYNSSNTRNFGIPEARVSSANFLNQWGQDGGNRRIVVALRFSF